MCQLFAEILAITLNSSQAVNQSTRLSTQNKQNANESATMFFHSVLTADCSHHNTSYIHTTIVFNNINAIYMIDGVACQYYTI